MILLKKNLTNNYDNFYSLITLQSVDTSQNSRLYYSFGKYAHVGRVGGNIRYLHVQKICNVFVISTLIWLKIKQLQ